MVKSEGNASRLPLPHTSAVQHGINEHHSLEFDGTAVLCRVCGDKASGFHYGVHSCEGCKGFFRRSIQQKIQYRSCTKNQQCSVLRVNRNRCQYCRLKKCISVGMSRDAVRFGRVPKREKARIMAAMEASHLNKNNQQNQLLKDDLTAVNELKSAIVDAHFQTCEFTKNKIAQLIQSGMGSTGLVENFATRNNSRSTCPLNPINYSSGDEHDNFSDTFSAAVRGVVEFAKLLPKFNTISHEDQMILLSNGVFEILLLRLSNMFINDKMICINGKIIDIANSEEEDSSMSNEKFLVQSMLKFTKSFNQWDLNDDVIGLYSSVVLLSWDRPGLSNPELIKTIQSSYRLALETLISVDLCNALESKIPDLRTLSALHSEKLLSLQAGSNRKCETANYASSSSAEEDVSMETEMSHSSHFNQYPYNSVAMQTPFSPSNDSGVDFGTCSSPSRSESSEPMSNPEESFHFLRRKCSAQETQCDSNINYNLDEQSDYEYSTVGHKKFRRRTLTSSTDTDRSTASSSPSYFQQQIYDDQIIERKSPLQLYPQLASALTRSASYINNGEDSRMTTWNQPLLDAAILYNSTTSDYVHRLIMRNGLEILDENQFPLPEETPLNLCINKQLQPNRFAT